VVAEGVENESVWSDLARLGCDEAQGYFLTRPVPAAELAAWLRERRRSFPLSPLAQRPSSGGAPARLPRAAGGSAHLA
jgi:predicted signal transduction protein with EAL and GGDEF domain